MYDLITQKFPLSTEKPDLGKEKQAYQTSALVFDISPIERVVLRGKDHKDLLHRLTMNETRRLDENEVIVNAFTNEKGRVLVAGLMVNNAEETAIIVGPGQGQVLAEWIDRFVFIEDVNIEVQTDAFHALLVCGRTSPQLTENSQKFSRQSIADCAVQVIAAEGVFPGGTLMLCQPDDTDQIKRFLCDKKGLVQGSFEMYELLRIDQGVPGFATELNKTRNPYECGLKKWISFTKGCYIGQEVVARLDSYDKIRFIYCGVSFPQNDVEMPVVIFDDTQNVGEITSVAENINGEKIGLALIRRKAFHEDKTYYLHLDAEKIPIKIRAFS